MNRPEINLLSLIAFATCMGAYGICYCGHNLMSELEKIRKILENTEEKRVNLK